MQKTIIIQFPGISIIWKNDTLELQPDHDEPIEVSDIDIADLLYIYHRELKAIEAGDKPGEHCQG